MATLVKLCQKDLDAYGYNPGQEWLLFDPDALNDLPGDRLEELEAAMDMTLSELYVREIPRMSAKARRAMAWLARQAAGLPEPSWDEFNPRSMRIEMKPAPKDGDDADPLAPTSSAPSSETTSTEDGSVSGADTPATTTTSHTSTTGRQAKSGS